MFDFGLQAGMRAININRCPKFDFIINNQRFTMSEIEAQVLSKKARQVLENDDNINSMCINISNEEVFESGYMTNEDFDQIVWSSFAKLIQNTRELFLPKEQNKEEKDSNGCDSIKSPEDEKSSSEETMSEEEEEQQENGEDNEVPTEENIEEEEDIAEKDSLTLEELCCSRVILEKLESDVVTAREGRFKKITMENAVKIANLLGNEASINFIASHLAEFDGGEIYPHRLREILSSPHLHVNSEDEVLNAVQQCIDRNGCSHSYLLGLVQAELLSCEKRVNYADYVIRCISGTQRDLDEESVKSNIGAVSQWNRSNIGKSEVPDRIQVSVDSWLIGGLLHCIRSQFVNQKKANKTPTKINWSKGPDQKQKDGDNKIIQNTRIRRNSKVKVPRDMKYVDFPNYY